MIVKKQEIENADSFLTAKGKFLTISPSNVYNFLISKKAYLSAKLVGYGIRSNGVDNIEWLETPLPCYICNEGLDHLLTYNGSDSDFLNVDWCNVTPHAFGNPDQWGYSGQAYPLWISNYGGHYGALAFSSYNSSAEERKANDNSYSDFTETLLLDNGKKYTGTTNNSYANFTFRVTHIHNSVNESTAVNNIAWFGKISSGYYPMFCNCVLQKEITLNAGESLITILDVNEVWDNNEQEGTLTNEFKRFTDVPIYKKVAKYETGQTSSYPYKAATYEPNITHLGLSGFRRFYDYRWGCPEFYPAAATKPNSGTEERDDGRFNAVGRTIDSMPTYFESYKSYCTRGNLIFRDILPYKQRKSSAKYRDRVYSIKNQNVPGVCFLRLNGMDFLFQENVDFVSDKEYIFTMRTIYERQEV